MGVTGPQLRVLAELNRTAQPPKTECWLIDGNGSKYHLVVQTTLGDNKDKLTTTPAVIAQLHGAGLIAYGNDTYDLAYWVDDDQRWAPIATPVHITDRGKQVQRDAARHPRHRAGAA